MASTSPRLLARLYRDLAELQEQPYPGVAVFIDDADIRKFCLVLTPPAGPWKGLALHFDVVLPPSWPSLPPSVSSSVHDIDHPNLFGGYICCDLLKPMDWLEDGYTGGYTPALTLRGLFLQFLTFFSSTFVEQDYGGKIEIGDAMISSFVLEKDIGTPPHLRLRCCPQYRCTCGSIQTHQRGLEGRWGEDTRPETVVSTYQATDGGVTHKTKGATPHPDRIHAFEKRNPRWQSTLDLIRTWACRRCPYGSPTLPHRPSNGALSLPVGQAPAYPPAQSSCALHLLDDDILLEIASRMLSEDLITFAHAYPRFHTLTSTHRILLLRELHCFFLKKPLNQGILGIGVSYEPGSRALSSDFDWLSLEAFDEHNVRKSIQKRGFQFFLPLAFNEGHFLQAREEIWKRVGLIDTAIRQAEVDRQAILRNNDRGRGSYHVGPARVLSPAATQPHLRFNVVFKMMNNIVVSLMKSCDDALTTSRRSSSSPNLLQASEKAVISYCHLMHLLIRISESHPPFLQGALGRVRSFLQAPANRTKDATPDMGELIVVITLILIMFPSGHPTVPTWSTLSGPFLEEAITRNVRWVLKDAPELEVMEEGASDYRLTTTFSKSRTSLRLIMFQITFLDLFIRVYHKIGIRSLDQNYGFPESQLPMQMVEEIKTIYKVNTWPGFFAKVQFSKVFSKSGFTGMLRDAVAKSRHRRYHTPARPAEMNRLRIVRRELERARAEAEARKRRIPQ